MQTAFETIATGARYLEAERLEAEDIHQVRVMSKRLRAYLRLLPKSDERKALDRELRDLARLFAGQRDSDVMRATVAKLLPDIQEQQLLLVELGIPCAPDDATSGESPEIQLRLLAQQMLQRIDKSWRQMPPLTAPEINEALINQYKQCRRRGRSAIASNSNERLHEWRKLEKYLLYQCELTELSASKKLQRKLKALAQRLGDHHDLVVLEAKLLQLESPSPLAKGLHKKLDKAKKRLHKAVEKQYRKTFEKPYKKLLK